MPLYQLNSKNNGPILYLGIEKHTTMINRKRGLYMYCTNLSQHFCIFDLTLYSFQNHCTEIDQYGYKNCLQCKGRFRGEGGGGALATPF